MRTKEKVLEEASKLTNTKELNEITSIREL